MGTTVFSTFWLVKYGCKVAFSRRRYRWRNDKVLKQISEQVIFHCERWVNTNNFIKTRPAIARKTLTLSPLRGKKQVQATERRVAVLGFCGPRDWILLSDIEEQYNIHIWNS